MSSVELTSLAQHAQICADNPALPDDERALWWQIAEEIVDYFAPVKDEPGLFE
jgi:hypothetical protein